MLRNIESIDLVTIDVFLRDGRSFLGKDIPNQPFGEHYNVVSFWEDDEHLLVFPMSDVAYVILNYPEPPTSTQ